jgi:hypothetical protein
MAGRATALLQAREDGLQYPVTVKMKLNTPESTPKTTAWFLEAKDAFDTQIGWGEDESGFKIVQMPESTVLYTGVPGTLSELTLGFR